MRLFLNFPISVWTVFSCHSQTNLMERFKTIFLYTSFSSASYSIRPVFSACIFIQPVLFVIALLDLLSNVLLLSLLDELLFMFQESASQEGNNFYDHVRGPSMIHSTVMQLTLNCNHKYVESTFKE